MNTSEVIVKCLETYGVDTVFGYLGGSVLELYGALKRSEKIRFVLSRHEQAAVLEAEGYARASGKVGVAVVSSGPAAANALTGLADAYLDNIPIVVIGGQVDLDSLEKAEFQEIDMPNIVRPVTKKRFQVWFPEKIIQIMKESFQLAVSGRPGPIFIDLPVDVSTMPCSLSESDLDLSVSAPPAASADLAAVSRAVRLIRGSKRPLILVGGGVISGDASETVMRFAREAGIGIVSGMMGKGAIPENDELFRGFVGVACDRKANRILQSSDLLIVVGSRLSGRLTGKPKNFAPEAKIIHIDIDAGQINKNIPADIALVGDASTVLGQMIPMIDFKKDPGTRRPEATGVNEEAARNTAEDMDIIRPTAFIRALSDRLDPDASIVTTGVGQHQIWCVLNLLRTRPRSFLTSCGMGTMGFDLPAAIGAAYACPDRQIVCVVGDGSIQMNIQEMAIANRDRLPIKLIVMNNRTLGMIWEVNSDDWNRKTFPPDLDGSPDYVSLAKAYQWSARMISRTEETDEALRWLLNGSGPRLLEVCFPVDAEPCLHSEYT